MQTRSDVFVLPSHLPCSSIYFRELHSAYIEALKEKNRSLSLCSFCVVFIVPNFEIEYRPMRLLILPRDSSRRPERVDRSTSREDLLRVALLLLLCLQAVSASWGGNDDESSTDSTMFGNSLSRDWLSNSNAISMQFEGCSWGYVGDSDNAGCMESSSQDGTTYWYQMANCRRAQAVFSLYATSSGSASCSKSNFKESVS